MRYEIVAQPGCVEILVLSEKGRREPVPIAEMTEQHWGFVVEVARLAAKYHVEPISAEGGTG